MDATLTVFDKQITFYDVDPASHIGNCLLNVGLYERPNLDFIRELNVVGNYVDVGAHIGTHAIFFSLFCPSRMVYAFEPHQASYKRLRVNLAGNRIHNCLPFPVALVEDNEAKLPVDQGEVWMHRTLDSFQFHAVKVLKIDVESAELRVLQGAKETLHQVEHLFLEVWNDEVYAKRGEKSPMADICAFLEPYGIRYQKPLPWEDLHWWRKE